MIGFAIATAIFAILDIGFWFNFSNYDSANQKLVIIWTLITIVLGIITYLKRSSWSEEKAKRKAFLEEQQFARANAINSLRSGILPVEPAPQILLKRGEIAHFQCGSTLYSAKEVTVRTSQPRVSVSVRIMKGISLRQSYGGTKRKTKRITSSHWGLLCFTNKRIVFLNNIEGFDISYNKLTNIQCLDDGIIIQAQ